jgi:predicted phosphodiesterase
VGSTTQPRKRNNTHLRELKNGKHPNKRLQKWFDDNGGKQLYKMVLDYLPSYNHYVECQNYAHRWPSEEEYRQHIIDREQYFISLYRPQGIFNYNDATFSSWHYNVGSKRSTDTREKQSRSIADSYTPELRKIRSEENSPRWSQKALVFGDIHLDTTIIPKVEQLFIEGNYDRLIFVGDELDSFYLDYKNSMVVLNQLKNLKDKYNKLHQRFIWCAGNHTLSYLTDQHCSGFDKQTYDNIHDTLITLVKEKYISPFYQYHGILYSHAGFVNNWLDKVHGVDKKDKLKTLESEFYNLEFDRFQSVGFARGGIGYAPSCLWADQSELLADPLQTSQMNRSGKPYMWKQVVGHSPVRTIESYMDDKLWFVDVFSTYRDGTPIGDGTVLEITDGKIFTPIKLGGQNERTN